MSRSHRDAVLIGLGAAALILLALGLLDGRWFGIAPYHVGLADQLLHLIVGVGSLVMGLAGTGAITVPVVTGAYRRSELGLAGVAGAAAGTDPGSAPEPAEAMPEPLGLDLEATEPAPGPKPEATVIAEPGSADALESPAALESADELESPAKLESPAAAGPVTGSADALGPPADPGPPAEPSRDGDPDHEPEAAAGHTPTSAQESDTH
jgi:hypothetical protein